MSRTKAKKYEIDMCNGPILKKMLVFAIPLVCSGVLQLLFNAADVIVVGQFAGDNSLAAVGSTTSLVNLFTNLFIGLSIGVNVLVARYFGAKRERELSDTVHTAIAISLLSGVILAILGIVFSPMILKLMSTPKNVLPLATVYLRVYFVGMPALMLYNFGAAILRAIGDTKRPLYFLIIAGVINVVFNLLFVIVFKLDVFGVALATTISQVVSAYFVLRCLMKETGGIHVDIKKLSIKKSIILNILQIGLPAGLQSTLFSLSNVLIQSSINGFGEIVVAGNSAAANLEGFVYVGMNAFYQANISFTSQNIGAGKINRLNRLLFCGQACVIVVGLILGVSCYMAGPQLLLLYTDSPAVVAEGMIRFSYVALPYVLCGIMEVMVGSLRGMGYAVFPMLVSLIGSCGLRILWLQTVFKMEHFHTVETVYIIYPISWIITTLAHIVTYVIVYRKIVKKYQKNI